MSPARSITGNHDLLPSSSSHIIHIAGLKQKEGFFAWTWGNGTVIWRIWPAVITFAAFAAIIVAVSQETNVDLGIPSVMLTVTGVVIGFVISYRASSGYDRYWMGRCAWSDVIKNTRGASRLIWIHVPPRVTKGDNPPPHHEIGQVMREKRIALELLEGFAVSLKHHLRGELGIYYEDLYKLVRPLHEHPVYETAHHPNPAPASQAVRKKPSRHMSIDAYAQSHPSPIKTSGPEPPAPATGANGVTNGETLVPPDHRHRGSATAVEPESAHSSLSKNAGKQRGPRHRPSYVSLASSTSSGDERAPLLPASNADARPKGTFGQFTPLPNGPGLIIQFWRWITRHKQPESDRDGGVGILWGTRAERVHAKRQARQTSHHERGKHRPRVAGDGQNLPLEVLRSLSEWLCILEARGTVGPNAICQLFSCLVAFEDSLSTLERILTTPLPFVYSSHLRHVVWLYLIFLPFQLAHDFKWYTIPGTGIAAFFYLGFLAAGEEIEQPFGYDENDLDLDLFCREIIKVDIMDLMMTPFPNAPESRSAQAMSGINLPGTIVDVSQKKRPKHEDSIDVD